MSARRPTPLAPRQLRRRRSSPACPSWPSWRTSRRASSATSTRRTSVPTSGARSPTRWRGARASTTASSSSTAPTRWPTRPSALSFALVGLDRPVVLTGSQRPLGEIRTDARRNLVDAVDLATRDIPEVGICFDGRLLRGNRATKGDAWSYAAFASPGCAPLARLGLDVEIGAARAPAARAVHRRRALRRARGGLPS